MFDLVWGAYFKGALEPLWQYDAKGTEIPFSRVLENQNNLEQFVLVNRRSLTWYKVDLRNGTISIAQETLPTDDAHFLEPREDMLRKGDTTYRLIYFREVTRTFDSHLTEVSSASINFFLGFQYTDSEGHNHKRLMCINRNGQVVIN